MRDSVLPDAMEESSPTRSDRTIYKIASRTSWNAACQTGTYAGSPDDLRDGFIHFSTEVQLQETARKHFAGQTDLVLIAVDVKRLGDDLKWETSRGGALFPHLFATLDTDAAEWVRKLSNDQSGVPDVKAALTGVQR